MGAKMDKEQEKLLNEIHELANNSDHLLVPFDESQLEMAKAVIARMTAKLKQIADLIQVVCGD